MSGKDEKIVNPVQVTEEGVVHDKEIVKGGISAFTARIIGMGFSWLFAIIIARGYGAAGSGLYNLSQSLMNFMASITKMGSDTLMTRYGAQYAAKKQFGWIKDLYNKSMLVSVPLAIFFSGLLFFLAPWIATKVFDKSDPTVTLAFRIAAFSLLPVTVFNISNGGLRGLKQIRIYSLLQNVSNFFFGCIIITIFLFITRDIYAPVITYVSFITITGVLAFYFFLKYSRYSTTQVEKGLDFNEKFWIGVSLFIASFASLVRGYSDTFVLGRYATIEDVGIYRNAFKIATVARIALTAFLVPAAPRFSELFSQGKMKELGQSAQFATKVIFWTSAPILLVIILFPKPIMSVFGEKFTEGSTALVILAIGQFINAATGPVSNILVMTGKQKINRNLMVLATIAAIALDLWLIPIYGATAAAAVNTFGVVLMNMIPFFLIKYYYGFYTLDVRDLFKISPKGLIKDIRKSLKQEKRKKVEKENEVEEQIGTIE
ncbi:MAG: flippase [Chitinophagales bacterium]|nr:flippase [Chitinophagales bacterium]